MTIYDIFSLLGGLGLFLYGMDMMGKGLESAAGNKLKTVLEKLTSNRLRGVLVGALVTCVIQSSSATTVMVVGFVNAGLMNLSQAFGVILGANIGTTITAQIIALDLSELAPLFIIIGAAISLFTVYFYVGAAFYTGPRDGTMLLFTKKKRLACGALPRFDRCDGLCRRVFDGRLSGPWHGAECPRHRAADSAGFPPFPF